VKLPTEWIFDPYISEKARHMLRRHSPEYVSAYLGMDLRQVHQILKVMPMSGRRGRPAKDQAA
jgi:hypothetical protein